MQLPPIPEREAERLAALRDLVVLDSPPEPVFDRLADMARAITGAPIALITLIDSQRQWFKANVGLPGSGETPREHAFCAHTIMGDAVLEVTDATQDARFCDNPYVTGSPDIRFYAGAPLVAEPGLAVGSLCVIDSEARALSPAQSAQLRALAAVVVDTLAMRRDLITRALSVRSDFEQALARSEARFRAIVEDQAEMVSQALPDGEIVYVNPAYARHFDLSPERMLGTNLFDYVEPAELGAVRALIDAVLADGATRSGENRMAPVDGKPARWIAWTNTVQTDAQGRRLVHSVGRDITEHKRAEQLLRTSELFLRRTGRVSGVAGWEMDLRTGEVIWSERMRALHEVAPDFRPTRDNVLGFYAPASRAVIDGAIQAALRQGAPCDAELELRTARGRTVWVRVVGEAEFEDGRPVRLVGALQDISERHHAQAVLRNLTATLQSTIEAVPAVIAVVGADERYRFVNSAFERWSGQPREAVIGRGVAEVIGAEDYACSREALARVLAGDSVSFERASRRPGGMAHFALDYIPMRRDDGTVDGFVGVAHDISQLKREAGRLQDLAQRDALTGLLNRAGFEVFLAACVQRGEGAQAAVLYVDLDHFKPVNDQYGHPVGDQLLRMVASRLSALVRPGDAVARLGGDEFALVLCPLPGPRQAGSVADKIVSALNQRFEIEGRRIGIGGSVGVAYGVGADGDWQALVARADQQLYRAKREGRGRQSGGA